MKQIESAACAGISIAMLNKAKRRGFRLSPQTAARRKALRPAAEKKVCAEFRFLHMCSRGWHCTRFEARAMKWESLTILAVLALAILHLVTAWLAKH